MRFDGDMRNEISTAMVFGPALAGGGVRVDDGERDLHQAASALLTAAASTASKSASVTSGYPVRISGQAVRGSLFR